MADWRKAQRPSLQLTVGPFRFTALWEEEAPHTAAALRRLLPVTSTALLEIWSGDVASIALPPVDVPLENATAHPWSGQIVYLSPPSVLLLVFGGCALRDRLAERVGTHVATVVEGLDELRLLGDRLTEKGAQATRIEEAGVLMPRV